MRTYVLCGLALVAQSANAGILKFDLEMIVDPSSTWLLSSPKPGSGEVSFFFDTLSGAQSFTFGNFADPSGEACVQTYRAGGASITGFSAVAGGEDLWLGSSLFGNLGGDNASGRCPGSFFSALGVEDSGNSFLFSHDPRPGMSEDAFTQSDDPLLDLYLGFTGFPSTGSLIGDWGVLNLSFSQVSVSSVPEPGAFALLALGLVAVAIGVRKRGRA